MLMSFGHFFLVAVCGYGATYGILIISIQEMQLGAGKVPEGLTGYPSAQRKKMITSLLRFSVSQDDARLTDRQESLAGPPMRPSVNSCRSRWSHPRVTYKLQWVLIEIRRYLTVAGQDVFGEWLSELKDVKARARIAMRIDRLANGNFGDAKSIGGGLRELRIDWGPGYRVYYGMAGSRPASVRRRQT
jgi:putative addiction module killer protein